MCWKLAGKMLAAGLMLVLVTALAWGQFPGGGQPGGGPPGGGRPGGFPGGPGGKGKGGNPFSPDAFFNRLSNGKDFITISEATFMKQQLEDFAKNNNITDGKITKEQFTRMMDDFRQKMQNGQLNIFRPKGGTPGGPAPAPGAAGAAPGGPSAPPPAATAPPSKEDIEAKVKEEVDKYFERYDKNKNGFIEQDEMSKNLKEKWKEFDKDGDGKLNRAELTEYLRGFVEWRLKRQSDNNNNNNQPSNNNNNNQPAPTNISTVDQSILDERPVVYRAGNLPKGLPDWFYKLDLNGDGQIDLYEWRKGTEPLSKFAEWDRDGDGFITAEEVMFKTGVTLVSADTEDAKGPNGTADFSAGNQGKNKGKQGKGNFRMGGPGGFTPGGGTPSFGPPGGGGTPGMNPWQQRGNGNPFGGNRNKGGKRGGNQGNNGG